MEDLISQLLLHLRGIWKYRWLAAAASWVLALAGWAVVYSMPNEYQSSARVYVDTQTILKPLLAGMTSLPNADLQVSIMSRSLLSRPNLERVIRMVDLDLHAADPRQQEQQVERMAGAIRITGTRAQDIYTITYRDTDPRLARDVVQSLLTIFVEGSLQGKQNDSHQAVKFIDEQIKSYEARLVAAENALKLFKQRNSLLLPRQGVDYQAQVAQAGELLAGARLELLEAEQTRKAVQDQIDGAPSAAPLRISHPELDARIATVVKNLDTLRLQFTEQHPDVISGQRLLAQLEERKRAESARRDADPGLHYSPMLQQLKVALAQANGKIAAARVRVAEFGARQERLLRHSQSVPELESQLVQLNRDYEINKDNYEKLIIRREAARLSGELSSSTEMMSFRIIDPPTMPVAAAGPDRPLLSTLVLLGALAGGAGAALLLSQARPTFSGPGEMREWTGLQVLGAVTMLPSPLQARRRRQGGWALGLSFGVLLAAWAGVLGAAMPSL